MTQPSGEFLELQAAPARRAEGMGGDDVGVGEPGGRALLAEESFAGSGAWEVRR